MTKSIAQNEILNKKQAVEFLKLDQKTFDNFQKASEFKSIPGPRKGWYFYDKSALDTWQKGHRWRTVSLNKGEYIQCLDFALAMHFRDYVKSNFGTATQREFGQMITNWMKGQLGEVGVKKFFKQKFNVDVILDFQLHNEIVPQDVIGILKKGKTRQPQIGIGIKSSKAKNTWLILGENEIERKERRSDIYIFCRVHIPDDHLLRITKEAVILLVQNQQHYDSYMQKMPSFSDIPCEIAGWCYYHELEKMLAKTIPGLESTSGFRYAKQSGFLKKSRKDWQHLLSML